MGLLYLAHAAQQLPLVCERDSLTVQITDLALCSQRLFKIETTLPGVAKATVKHAQVAENLSLVTARHDPDQRHHSCIYPDQRVPLHPLFNTFAQSFDI